jgi:hypothetical protein
MFPKIGFRLSTSFLLDVAHEGASVAHRVRQDNGLSIVELIPRTSPHGALPGLVPDCIFEVGRCSPASTSPIRSTSEHGGEC